MAEPRITIDPADFTDSQWVELYNASTIMPKTYEKKWNAKPFKRNRKAIAEAAQHCRSKAKGILAGELGGPAGENEQWAEDLEGAAEILEGLVGSGENAQTQLLYQIAWMTNEAETEGGFTSEDAIAALNDLIASAREVTGIDPQHPIRNPEDED